MARGHEGSFGAQGAGPGAGPGPSAPRIRVICVICGLAFREIHVGRHHLRNRGCALPPQQPPHTLDGREVDPLRAEQGVAATALIFTRTDCPVANQAAPEMERVRAMYADRGIRFWLVYVDPQEPADRIMAHMAEYGLRAPAIRDPDHALVKRAGVHVTPEAALYRVRPGAPRLIYRGRHRRPRRELGRQRPAATRFDLRDAIESALAAQRLRWWPRRRPVARSRT